ncbi:MAG: polyprenyl synthetase family protein [Thiohalocapsa sp.]|uniref:polyprenyl synthetase family protein n=1 Tax=Thiohalocapsa sp. TaxID=2497641 RepID=UPI0025F64501|nr:polyprenyl synthetase family protein [Thiohalocapsa sp.]MCG6939954.1 polyprenyl synthetase family protein [Thiohalocapsa sp.]
MDVLQRIEQALEAALTLGLADGGPPQLGRAVRHAVMTPGSRARPRLVLAVAGACGDDAPAVSDAAAASLELLHCASLVHDDMPVFDDADTRRGQPTVHRLFPEHGEQLALLAGDGLIVLAFENLAWHTRLHPERLGPLTLIVARAVGVGHGIVAGQAWECEQGVDLTQYHREKTAALFSAATQAGAAAAGMDPGPWRTLGENLGLAYQVADDLRDVAGDAAELGKPVGQDAAHDRPSAVAELGVEGAVARLKALLDEAIESIPACPGRDQLAAMARAEMERLLPAALRG